MCSPLPPAKRSPPLFPATGVCTNGWRWLSFQTQTQGLWGWGWAGGRGAEACAQSQLEEAKTHKDTLGPLWGRVEAHFISLVLREPKKKTKSLNQKGKRASASSPSRQRRVSFWQESEQNQNKTKDQIKWWFSIDVNIDIAQGTAGTQRPDTSVDIG